uniref:Uncharacterized protein n=1 Tax=Candidatus Kentrum sp. FM TaxID=2126340 RepID=A0A450TR81_9GAMM|nr:MAG: hypothetical protein BECKFM1743A_GA0114220_105514 [Candidatus Kentron sp. FM]VFK14756.1 MAG: hypothetical protein BECKFM1743B_GA0114221_103386 [Candidatus Kentron sp. FM]
MTARMSTEKHGKRRKIFHHRGPSAAEPQPKCLNFEEVNHKDTKKKSFLSVFVPS